MRKHASVRLVIFCLVSLLSCGAFAYGSVYNFTGALEQPFNGNNLVTGQFDLNTSTGAISSFHFTTPVETIDSTGPNAWSGATFIVDGINPNSTFVNLVFLPGGGLNPPDAMQLIFQTTLSAFDVGTFYTGPIQYSGGTTQSNLTCINGCNGYGSLFVATTAVPEPTSMILFGSGFLGFLARRRRQEIDFVKCIGHDPSTNFQNR